MPEIAMPQLAVPGTVVAGSLAGAGALLAMLVGGRARTAHFLATAALLFAVLAAATLPLGPSLRVADVTVADAIFARVVVAVGGLAVIALQVVAGLARLPGRTAAEPAALALTIAVVALSLSLSDPVVSTATAVTAGLVALAAAPLVGGKSVRRGATATSTPTALLAPFRLVAGSGIVIWAGISVLASSGVALAGAIGGALPGDGPSLARGGDTPPEAVAGGALLATGLVLRVGAWPHRSPLLRHAARAALPGVVLVSTWALLPLVVLASAAASAVLGPGVLGTGPAAAGLVVTAPAVLVTVVSGVAAVVVRDAGRRLASIAASGAAIALLAAAAPDASQLDARSWLVTLALAVTAAAAAFVAGDGGRKRGAPVRPLPYLSLVVVAIALAGWPGTLGFETRARLVAGSLAPSAHLAVLAASFLPALAAAVAALRAARRRADEHRATPAGSPGRWRLLAADLVSMVLALGALAVSLGLTTLSETTRWTAW